MIPTEDQEGAALAQYLRSQGYRFTHIANEIGIRGHIGMLINKKKVRQGLSKGFPDYIVLLRNKATLFIELKRQRKVLKNGKLGASPSVVSEEQLTWIEALNGQREVEAYIAYGWEHARQIIQDCEAK